MPEDVGTSVEFRQVGSEYAGAETLRVVHAKGEAMLVVSRTAATPPMGALTTISALRVGSAGDTWKTVASLREVVPAGLAFDAAYDASGKIEIVHERPGGAINALMLRRQEQTASLSAGYPLESFSRPRFAKKPDATPAWATAVLDRHVCVAFGLPLGGAYKELGACDDGLLVQVDTGFVLLSKMTIPGLARENGSPPGKLQATHLDSALKPLAPPVAVKLGTIFQFDAEFSEGRLILVATTAHGVAVGSASPANLGFATKQYQASATLTYPSIVPGVGGQSVVYALDAGGSATAHVVAERVQVP